MARVLVFGWTELKLSGVGIVVDISLQQFFLFFLRLLLCFASAFFGFLQLPALLFNFFWKRLPLFFSGNSANSLLILLAVIELLRDSLP